MPLESNSWRKDVSRAYALLRFTLGLNICLHGIVRWIAGSGNFAQPLVTMFQKTPLPAWSVYGFGLALPAMEALIGAAVAIGFRTRVALFAGTVLMLALMFGTTLRQDWATAGIQLNYSFIYCLLLAGIRFDHYGADSLLHRGT
jgi:thiosulfate dehydrogenase [quinone] large subunit